MQTTVHLIRIVESPENIALIEALSKVPGVTIDGREKQDAYMTIAEGAEFCKTNYYTFREWVVMKKLIPFSRPSGRCKGDIRVKRSDVIDLMAGKKQKQKPGRKGREVSPLD